MNYMRQCSSSDNDKLVLFVFFELISKYEVYKIYFTIIHNLIAYITSLFIIIYSVQVLNSVPWLHTCFEQNTLG